MTLVLNMRVLGCVAVAFIAVTPTVSAEDVHRWNDDTLRTFALLPIQDGGRVKPLDTYARFTLLRLNGKRTLTTDEGERLSALEWLLNVLLYPEDAVRYRHFCVDNSEVLVELGLDAGKPRERYSYEEIAPVRDRLLDRAMNYSLVEDKDRDAVQRLTLNLAANVRDFEALSRSLDFARQEVRLNPDHPLREIVPDGVVTASRCLAQGSLFQQLAVEDADLTASLNRIQSSLLMSNALALFPPSDTTVAGWHTPSSLASLILSTSRIPQEEIQLLAATEVLVRAADSEATFLQAAQKLNALAFSAATKRDEYAQVPAEVRFYRLNPLFWAQWLFVLSFVFVAISWLMPKPRWLQWCVIGSVLLPWAFLVVGIVFRCIIRGRPPVSTLYESILFVTAVVVLIALLLERSNRQEIAVALASVVGTAGLFLAYKHEAAGGMDTMPSLVAVLDTNFWLSTHVTTVTTGYAAGLLAGFLGCVQILSRLFGIRSTDQAYYQSLTRMIYGTVCFGLLFSFVGTVLGGIWANYSWGRFWGWDPKENGALLIVLCNLGILHARLGGMIRELGMAMAAVFGGMVVAFSWWGVNLLGVGLHSYGFTSGVWNVLLWFWLSQVAIIAAGAFVYMRAKVTVYRQRRQKAPASTPIAEPIGK